MFIHGGVKSKPRTIETSFLKIEFSDVIFLDWYLPVFKNKDTFTSYHTFLTTCKNYTYTYFQREQRAKREILDVIDLFHQTICILEIFRYIVDNIFVLLANILVRFQTLFPQLLSNETDKISASYC